MGERWRCTDREIGREMEVHSHRDWESGGGAETDRLGERWRCRDRHTDCGRGGGAKTHIFGERWRCTDRHMQIKEDRQAGRHVPEIQTEMKIES